MPNMSYCRFENTAKALQDCVYAIQENEVNNLSTYEVNGLAEIQLLAIDEYRNFVNNSSSFLPPAK